MKERILYYLNDFAQGKENNLAVEICTELNFTREELRLRSRNVLSAILHQYSLFAISTIDAFFQKVIRSFTREAGLLGNFRLEVENELVLKEVVDELMEELGTNKQLTDWVVDFSRDRLMEGENWNIVASLNGFAKEVFSETFQAIEDKLEKPTGDINPYKETMSVLRKEIALFDNFMKGKAKEALSILENHGITADDFNYKDSGTALRYFLDFAKGKYYPSSGPRIQSALISGTNWPSKKSRNYAVLVKLANEKLIPILTDMVTYAEKNATKYNSVSQVLKNFYAFGLIADITRKLKLYKQENNIMLLSDAPKFLNGVINDSDTPFIYEKVGSYFRNYLIDEFQDTSGFQWKNFQPLLKDALDQFQASMVVGDVKQSIYRWRGGDQQLLQQEVSQAMGDEATDIKELIENYRSAELLVNFNNALFSRASQRIADITGQPMAADAYRDVKQKSQRFAGKGFVQITFLEKQDDAEDWTDESMRQLPRVLEDLQDQKVTLKDIAILVRKNEEGQRIATELLQYKNTEAKPGYRYDVVSNESLRLDTAASVNLLLSALRYLHNPKDAIVCGELAYEVTRGKDLETIFQKAGKFEMNEILPEEFHAQTAWLNKLSVFELTEELIRMFNLGGDDSELAYIQAFQDLVLEFSGMEKNDLSSFLEWWENIRNKRSIQVAGNVDAVNIITIHKSKGLQFKYVIIPFLNWKLTHDQINAPLLWVQSDKPPFDTMGYLAVKQSSKLDETFFEEAYREELTKTYIDNLNLLYVSFTRAEEGLIAFADKPRGNQAKPTTAGDLVFEVINYEGELAAYFKDDQLTIGQMQLLDSREQEDEYMQEKLTRYASYDWRQKLVIKREGIEFFEESVSEKRTKINYGILMHRLLAHVHHQAEAESVLNELHIQNVFTEEERIILLPLLQTMMTHPVAGKWFAKEWEVRTEVPVLIPGGKQSRIDRVMIGRKNTVVIDYKTGEKKEQDRRQVEGYTGLLTQMGYPNVEGYLLYLDEMEVVEVVKGSTLSFEF